jgi:tRNA(Ile)-lysidine synthase
MRAVIHRYSMMENGETVLVAVSGGPDSVALFHALWKLRSDLGIGLHAAHLNHSIRGAASDADAEYVRRLADALGIGVTIEKIDVPKVRETLRLSIEEAARLVRYDFLERCAAEVGAARIAVGHNADDQVETVLLNLLRGTGIDGISGMPPVREKIVRPLLHTRRSEIEEYIRAEGLQPRIDATNLVPEYTRNRIRLQLLPQLRSGYNSEIDAGILRLSELARDDNAYLNKEAESLLSRSISESAEGSIRLDAAVWAKSPTAIRRRLVRAALRRIGGSIADIGFVHVESFLRLIDAGTNFRYEFPGGVFVHRSGGHLDFMSERPHPESIEYCRNLAVPGTTLIPEIGISINTGAFTQPIEYRRPRGSQDVVLDNACVSGMLKVRSWRPGDRVRPLGLGGTKKLQDVFVDSHIPESARHRVPIVADDEKILWVAGILVSDDCKVTESTTSFLRLGIARD